LIWLVRDFDLLAVLLHAATLSLEAVLLGGIFFLAWIAPARAMHGAAGEAIDAGCRRLLCRAAIAMVLAEWMSMGVAASVMMQGTSLSVHDLFSAIFLRAELISVALSIVLAVLARKRVGPRFMLPFGLALVASTVWLSHAVSRMDHRLLLATLTALHHLGTDAWIGAMPYLLIGLKYATDGGTQERMIRRFSKMAMLSVAVLVSAGVGMSWWYVGSPSGLYATSYGIMLLAKIYLLLLMLTLGGANWYLLRSASTLPQPFLLRIRRFSETEIGLGLTVLLAAASLTSQPPAADVTQGRATRADYAQRLRPEWPRWKSPPVAALGNPSAMQQAIVDQEFNGLTPSDANDIAWSEYNHNWAGIVVFAAGLLALLSQFRGYPGLRWTRYWPLAFLGLAVFILLRADPEAWPLGPRPFWATFSAPDTLEHRFAALLIAVFAFFECAVQAGKLRFQWAALIFPGVCALGAAVLLTHGHESGSARDEVLANVSHIAIALLGATAGWARWLELRLGNHRAIRRSRQIAAFVWPVALMLAGAVLVNYREA
jgi:putative copper resistance protein D